MRHVELHIIETDEDINTGLLSGLLSLDDLDILSCIACTDDVGQVDGAFYGFVVAIDHEDLPWYVCTECASDVVSD